MTAFDIRGNNLEMWLHQNCAEIADERDGVLLDHYLVYTKNGIAAIHEHYLNSNSSDYRVVFARKNSGAYQSIENSWFDFAARYDKEI